METPKKLESSGALVFDLDGTLTDTSEDIAYAINLVRKDRNLPALSTPAVLKAVGKGAPRLIQKLFGIPTKDPIDWTPILDAFNAAYLTNQGDRSHLYPGMEAALTTLSKQFDLYVLSNKPHPATTNEIEKQGIGRYFKAAWGAGCFDALKPSPFGIVEAMKRSNAPVERCIMIGDMPVDIEAGNNAGVQTLHVTWGFGRVGKNDPAPTAVADSVEAMIDEVYRLMRMSR